MKLSPVALLIAAAVSAAPLAAPAQDNRRAPTSAVQMKSSFAPVVRSAAPAVVNIAALRRSRARTLTVEDLISGSAPRERVQGSEGSGVIVSADGIVVTNRHVIANMTEIYVGLADNRQFPAKVLLQDARSDLAVLKIDAGGARLPTLRIDTGEDAQVGDLVLAIGNPFGVGQTVTNGIVSALSRTIQSDNEYAFFIQTDAAINPGNSGGALVDMDGDLIGINTQIASASGGSNGVGFAVPARLVRQVVDSAVAGGQRVARPWLGARTAPIARQVAQGLSLTTAQGLQVSEIYPGSPADRAGLREGDVILAVDNQLVNDEASLNYHVATHRAGDQMPIRLSRGGAERVVTARLALPPQAPTEERQLAGRHPFDGATVANVSPALADERGIDPLTRGVAITGVTPNGGAVRLTGLRPGDIILEVNGVAIDTTARLEQVIANGGRQWRFAVQRGGQVVNLQQVI